jgi:glycosyltransferase involved in cell wall biosynthesis
MGKTGPDNNPRRILYVENGIGYGGAAICLRHLVRNLDRSAYLPMVITGRTGPQYEEIATESIWKHIPDRHIDIAGMKRKLAGSGPIRSTVTRYLLGNQILARLDDIFNFLPHFLQILWTTARFHPQLIHVNNEPLCNRAAILAGKILRIPVVCHVRGPLGEKQGGSRITRWLYSLPDHFIPVSHWISQGMAGIGVPEEKRTVIYDGIRLENMDTSADGTVFRTKYGIADGDFAVGLIGLLMPWKGQHMFLDAAHILARTIPDLKMLIIGGTPDDCAGYENELRKRVANEGLSDIVTFTGHLSDMPAVYNGLDVVVSASTSPEPLGTVVIESMAIGRPLVAPDHGGAAEMADDNETALLFTPGDSTSLAKAIHRLYADEGLRKQLGSAARTKALQTFDVAEHVRRVQEIYELL